MPVKLPPDLDARVQAAMRHFRAKRSTQARKQRQDGSVDHGTRSAVTGGKQLDGFIDVCVDLIRGAGIPDSSIFTKRGSQVIPGFFRATKQWDLLVVHEKRLICAIEAKSQVGSFGNNGNNRAEEALGNALDLKTSHRERLFGGLSSPWLGYLFILEDAPGSRKPIAADEPHFSVLPEFKNASYAKRIELLCSKLLLEGHYSAAALLMTTPEEGLEGHYDEPVADLSFNAMARSLVSHVSQYANDKSD